MFKKDKGQIEREISLRNKKDNVTSFEIFLIFIALIPALLELLSSFVYLYREYLLYSVIGIILGLGIFFSIPKFLKNKKFTAWYYFAVTIIVILLNVWFVPKLLHMFYFAKEQICFEAKLTYKIYFPRNESAKIDFDIEYINSIPKSIISFGSISGIPYNEYIQLPETRSKIKICGELSKVGFDYSYITLGK